MKFRALGKLSLELFRNKGSEAKSFINSYSALKSQESAKMKKQ